MSNVILYRDPADKSDPPPPIPVLPSARIYAGQRWLLLGPFHVVGLHRSDAPCQPLCFGKDPNEHAGLLWSPIPNL
jgi:hypothetical protein